jgi:hypothetical protein
MQLFLRFHKNNTYSDALSHRRKASRKTYKNYRSPRLSLVSHIDFLISTSFSFVDLLKQDQALARTLQRDCFFMQGNTNAALVEEEMEVQNQIAKRLIRVSRPLPNDVLFGRGRPLQAHHGNLRFHRIINKFREEYKNARKDEKVGTPETPDVPSQHQPFYFSRINELALLSHWNQGKRHSNCPSRGVFSRPSFFIYERQRRRRQ